MESKLTHPKVKTGSGLADFRQGLIQGLPILFGYIPAAIAFGVLGAANGLSVYETTAMSVWVFAGASQFMAINLLQGGAHIAEIIFATFVLNLRHLLMSTVLSQRISARSTFKAMLSFGITDETFVLTTCSTNSMSGKGEPESRVPAARFAGTALSAYTGWIAGTVLGSAFAAVIPNFLMKGMGISLYAMFIALLVPSLKRSGKLFVVAVLSALINAGLSLGLNISGGWSVVTATLLASATGAVLYKGELK